jgi:hypothetical protein
MKIYILTNFRILPYLSILQELIKNSKNKKLILTSRESITGFDYGEYLPLWNKKLKVFFLKIFYNVIIVETVNFPNEEEIDKTGIISSLMSITCDSGANKNKYPILYNNLYKIALGAYNIELYLKQINLKYELFLFNGRGAPQFHISLFASRNNIKISYFEYGNSSYSGYKLYPYPPHSLLDIGRDISNLYKNNNKSIFLNDKQIKIAQKLITEKLNNQFTKNLEATDLKFDVVVFLGSDHEYTGVSEEIVNVKLYGNFNLCKYAFEKYGNNYKIAVRAHPNQIVDCSATNTNSVIRDFCNRNGIVFFEPESHVSSHSLIKNSKIVVVEYSSISYDAIYLGKKVDILGDLDLKVILKEMPTQIRNSNANEISNYVAYVKYLESFIHFRKFSLFFKIISRLFTIIEKRIQIKFELN